MPVQAQRETERLTTAWTALTGWLAEHAPVSHASLLPPATEAEITAADSELTRCLGYGLPVELAALWRLCGGVEHQYIEENEEEGEIGSGAFLPGGVILSPARALWPRLPRTGESDYWGGAQVVPWLTGDEAGPESGHWVGTGGVGSWSLPDRLPGKPSYPSIAAYLETVHRTVTEGPADLTGPDVPGLVWGCLIWDDPGNPLLDDALEHWAPIH
ncbi:hypothetical protein ACH4VX_01960 [Streptomyces sp. NPDC020731]|uniref:hypothetical protein n=1 Tax=Streptomyces sp. NPDC020731 TaxID=3365085 RepID=UPI00379CFA75